jgi:hypothetical protein
MLIRSFSAEVAVGEVVAAVGAGVGVMLPIDAAGSGSPIAIGVDGLEQHAMSDISPTAKPKAPHAPKTPP